MEEADKSTGKRQSAVHPIVVTRTGLVSEIDQKATKDGRVNLKYQFLFRYGQRTHLVDNLQSLALGFLGALEGLLEAGHGLGVKSLSRGNGNLELSAVGRNKRVEVGENL